MSLSFFSRNTRLPTAPTSARSWRRWRRGDRERRRVRRDQRVLSRAADDTFSVYSRPGVRPLTKRWSRRRDRALGVGERCRSSADREPYLFHRRAPRYFTRSCVRDSSCTHGPYSPPRRRVIAIRRACHGRHRRRRAWFSRLVFTSPRRNAIRVCYTGGRRRIHTNP